jgi:hypothetical protein
MNKQNNISLCTQKELAQAYSAAAQDPDRKVVIEEWSVLDFKDWPEDDWTEGTL